MSLSLPERAGARRRGSKLLSMRPIAFCAAFALSVLVGSAQPELKQALNEFREPLRFATTVYAEGRLLSHAISSNSARFVSQRYAGWGYLRTESAGRVSEVWQTPNGVFSMTEGVFRRVSPLEMRPSEQENSESRLIAHLSRQSDLSPTVSSGKMPDGRSVRVYSVRTEWEGRDQAVELYLHLLRPRLLGFQVWGRHPLRESRAIKTSTFDDFRNVSGRAAPHHRRDYYDGQLFGEMQIAKLEIASKIDARERYRRAVELKSFAGRLPFSQSMGYRGLMPIVTVQLRGPDGVKDAKMLLDSGASQTIVSRSLASSIGLRLLGRVNMRSVSGGLTLDGARAGMVKLGRAAVGDKWIAVGDLGFISTALGVEGVLGSDFLGHFRVTFDFSKGEIRFEDARQPYKKPKDSIELGLHFIAGTPTFRCEVTGWTEGWLVLDTGAKFTSLPTSMVPDRARRASQPVMAATGATGLSQAMRGARVGDLKIDSGGADFVVEDLASLFTSNASSSIMPGTDVGVLGINAMRRFEFTVDYRSGKAYVRQTPPGNDKNASIGAVLRPSAERATVSSMIPVSPASIVLKRGDVLLSVNGRSTEGASPREVQSWLRGPENTRVRLVVLRDGESLELNLRRETLLY